MELSRLSVETRNRSDAIVAVQGLEISGRKNRSIVTGGFAILGNFFRKQFAFAAATLLAYDSRRLVADYFAH